MKHIVSRMSSYFPNRWPLSYLNLTKTMKTHIRRQQHKKKKKKKKKIQDIKQKEPSQKYRLGTISNTKLLAGLNRFYRRLTSPSVSHVKPDRKHYFYFIAYYCVFFSFARSYKISEIQERINRALQCVVNVF